MEKARLVKLLIDFNTNVSDSREDVENSFQTNYEDGLRLLDCSYDDILKRLVYLSEMNCKKPTYEWKFICLNFYLLELLNDELEKSDMEVLSVKETKDLKIALKTLMRHGILKRLQPNLPHRVDMQNPTENLETTDYIPYNYMLLKYTAYGFYSCIQRLNLRALFIPHCFQELLVAVYQIGYCPLKKPGGKTNANCMTEATYTKLLDDQQLFKDLLENLSKTIHPSIFIKETMVLFQANAPLWFKKAIANTLTKKMKSKKGVQYIALAMLDGSDDDTTKTWKILEILTKLILSCRTFPDFRGNICKQVLDLLDVTKATDSEMLIFERLTFSCTKYLYAEDKELCQEVFVERITTPLRQFVNKEHRFSEHSDVTNDIEQTVRLLYGCFVDNSPNSPCLPINLLKTFLNVLLHFYHLTVGSTFESTNKELKDLLRKYLHGCTALEFHELLDNFLFGFAVTDIPQIRNDVIITVDEKIVVETSSQSIVYATPEVMLTVYDLLETDHKIILFGYLLKCITDKEKYLLVSRNSTELLGNEDHGISSVMERLLTIHKLLSQLSENKDVQRSLWNTPDDIIEYINNVLSSKISDSQLVFVVVMILDNLFDNASVNVIHKYRVLMKPLASIAQETTDTELKRLCNKIIRALSDDTRKKVEANKEKTELDQALEDVYDPLLPTRGHGLLVLSKLIEKKDKQALERKHYLLNLFQLHLKNDDSFIYLSAVQGLVSLTNVFTDTILEILCDEYTDFSKKGDDAQTTRMKLGEALVRVVKLLGDMAPKYKSVLLNTFLFGTKDDDHLIRASSLSNLGEVCRVLNYKLGTIVTEVLVCVHAIITTDKAVEARRAAVTVIRQLFVGLQSEMIAFLKEDILPIYRTLKEIYYHDKDDVMKLQAQLALEELNENMKSIVFPNPQLHLEKKIVLMD